MSVFNVTLIVYLCVLLIPAAQGIFYLLCFAKVFGAIPVMHFVEIRKLVDPLLELPLKITYYLALISGFVFMILSFQFTLLYQIAAMSTLVLLISDILLAKKKSVPLNKAINLLTEEDTQRALTLRRDWLNWIVKRGCIAIAGALILIVTAVIG